MGLSCRFSLKPIHWRNLQHSILKTIGPQMVKLLLSLARRHALLKEEVAVGRSWVCWLDRCWMPFMVMFDHFCWLAEYIHLHRHLHVYILYTSNYMYTYVYIYIHSTIYIHTYTLSIYTYIYIYTYIHYTYIYRVYAGVFSWSWQRRKIISPLVEVDDRLRSAVSSLRFLWFSHGKNVVMGEIMGEYIGVLWWMEYKNHKTPLYHIISP